MRYKKKLIVLLLISTIFTYYTISCHVIANGYLYVNSTTDEVFWTSGPAGSFFPWPKAPGLLEILTQLNEVDLFIFQYLIRTWALAGLSIILWAITGLFLFKMTKTSEQPRISKIGSSGSVSAPACQFI